MTASATCAIDLAPSVTAITDTYDYDAFGNLLNKTGTTPNNYLYRGEQYDPDLGLYYLRARYYNPATGRFMSRDPENGKTHDPKTLHKYLYADGDPVNGRDPTGRADIVEERLLKAELDSAAADGLLTASRVICEEITVPGFVLEETTGQGPPQPIALPCKAISAANVVYLALLGLGVI
jgi:RHS repeat-associated protein